MPSNPFQRVLTRDGSTTLYSLKFGQHFHNPNGAIAESRHVFFEMNGIIESIQKKNRLTIAETGFGTGLSLLLLCEYIDNLNCNAKVDYYAVEGYPITPEQARGLNYNVYLNLPELVTTYPDWFKSVKEGGNEIAIMPNLTLHLYYGTLETWNLESKSIDYFFHDPFSVEVNPEGWSREYFERMLNAARYDAILTTYAAATRIRAALAAAGWQVASAIGALGKREMTLASPDASQLSGVKLLSTARLKERFDQDFGGSGRSSSDQK